jgi:hypothetical protein
VALSQDVIEVFIVLRGQAQYVEGMEQSAAATSQVAAAETEAADASKAAETQTKSATRSRLGSIATLVKQAAAVYGVYRAYEFLKGSISTVSELGRSTLQLERATGLDARTASAWVTLGKERGITARQMSLSFAALGRQIEGVQHGSKTAIRGFAELGVSLQDVARGDTRTVLADIADAFQRMPNGAAKAAAAQRYFGRAGQALLPVLAQGSAGVDQLLEHIRKLGGTMDQHGVEQAIKMARAERNLGVAMTGLRVAIGTALLPYITKASTALANAVANGAAPLRRAMGYLAHDLSGPVSSIFKSVGQIVTNLGLALGGSGDKGDKLKRAIDGLTAPLRWLASILSIVAKGGTAAGAGIAMLVAALVAYKLVMPAVTLATELFKIQVWELDAAMSANVIGLIIAGVAALAVGIYILYTKWKPFHDLVDASWAALKAFGLWVFHNWRPLLAVMTAPFAPFVAIVLYWRQLLNLAETVARRLMTVLRPVVEMAKTILKAANVGGALSGAVGAVGGALGHLPHFAEGGTMQTGGLALVGERGPELVSLPAGASVMPLPAGTSAAGAARGSQTVVKVFLDKRQIAEAVASAERDAKARR